MKRRTFIAGLGSAAAWPLAAAAQQGERARRIGVLMNFAADDPESVARAAAFEQELQRLGWTIGGNLQAEYRWGMGDAERYRKYSAELLMLKPDVLVAAGAPAVEALQRATRTVPIVFTNVTDPVGGGLVAGLAHPGANTTGFTLWEYGLSGKWLQLLKQIAPAIKSVAVLRDPAAVGVGQFAAIKAIAPSMQVELTPIDVRDASEIERAVTSFAREPHAGLIATAAAGVMVHRGLIISLAAKYQLPTIYTNRICADEGGLISYSVDSRDLFRRTAGYVDRILKGDKPSDMPVQNPDRYVLAINLKTAKAFGLTIPETLLATADEVIQ